MSSNSTATVLLWTNNPFLKGYVEKYFKELGLKVESDKKEVDYQIYIFDLSSETEDQSAKLADLFESSKKRTGKICLILINDSQAKKSSFEKYLSLAKTHLKDKTNDLRLIQTLDLYSSQTDFSLSPFQQLLYNTAAAQKINVSSAGDNLYFPTSLTDLCDLITKSLFISNTAGEVFTGTGQELTDLDLAYLLKKSLEKKDKPFDIDLSRSAASQVDNYSDASIRTQALLNWLPKTDLTDEIDRIIAPALNEEDQPKQATVTLLTHVVLAKLDRQTSKPNKKIITITKKLGQIFKKKENQEGDLHQTERRGLIRFLSLLILPVTFFAMSPFILTVSSLYLSTNITYKAYQLLRLGEDQSSRATLNQAKFWQGIAQNSFRGTIPLANLFSKTLVTDSSNFITILGHGQNVIESGLDSYALGSQLYLGVLGKQSIDIHANLVALRVNLVALIEKLSQIQLLIGQIKLPFGYDRKIKTSDLNDQIQSLKSQIGLGFPLLDLIDNITSTQSPQRHLLVIQDQNELRASGGFLTSNILISLNHGKIINLQTDSSLSIDRLIEGKIEPPAVVKQLLGQTTWLYHDSNIDADFSVSASQISWFYQRFKNLNLDGVIGFNLSFFESLLSEIGEVKLADGTVFNANNLNQLASNPTSDKGTDIVTALTQDLGQKLINGEIKFALLARALLKIVAHNEINLWFPKPSLQKLSQDSQLSGDIRHQPCHPQLAIHGCQADFFHLNESNFSVNKLNYYLKRAEDFLVTIAKSGEVGYSVTYDYSYPVPAPTNLVQSYKAYYQLYLPSLTKNLTISLDNQLVKAELIKQTSLGQITKLEFFGEQTINQPHRLVITFTSVNVLDLKKPQIPFTLSYLKQPGTFKDNFSVKLLYPETLQPKVMTLPFKQTGTKELSFQTNTASHENIGLLFKNISL